jgi:TRAP-type C4-dicarboxylate transport system substrate-binding protein
MRKFSRILVSGVAAAVALGAMAFDASAGQELRLATAAPQKTPWGLWIQGIADRVEKASSGELKIKVFFGSQLGNEQVTMRQTVRGRIDISAQSNTATSLVVPEFALLSAPYLWDSPAHSDCAFDKYVGRIYAPMMEENGLVVLSWVEVGQEIVFSRKPIRTPADMAQMKVRVAPTKPAVGFFEAVGANPVPLGTTDSIPSLKTGTVNAAVFPTVYGIAIGTQDLAPNVIVTNHGHQIGTLVMSKKIWNTLSAQEQSWLRTASNEAGMLRKGIRDAEMALLAKIEKAGVSVYRPTAGELTQWRAAAKPAREELVGAIGGKAPGVWNKIIEARDACRK